MSRRDFIFITLLVTCAVGSIVVTLGNSLKQEHKKYTIEFIDPFGEVVKTVVTNNYSIDSLYFNVIDSETSKIYWKGSFRIIKGDGEKVTIMEE